MMYLRGVFVGGAAGAELSARCVQSHQLASRPTLRAWDFQATYWWTDGRRLGSVLDLEAGGDRPSGGFVHHGEDVDTFRVGLLVAAVLAVPGPVGGAPVLVGTAVDDVTVRVAGRVDDGSVVLAVGRETSRLEPEAPEVVTRPRDLDGHRTVGGLHPRGGDAGGHLLCVARRRGGRRGRGTGVVRARVAAPGEDDSRSECCSQSEMSAIIHSPSPFVPVVCPGNCRRPGNYIICMTDCKDKRYMNCFTLQLHTCTIG